MGLKKVKYLLPASPVDMGGIMVKQAIPTMQVNQVDPFLLLHHGQFKPIYDRPALHQGIGPHPHRGFSPVTFVIDGSVHHRDSRGNSQIARAGEVQWMHAGAGIIHSERPSEEVIEQKGVQEIIQLWINSPASNKMKEPTYQFLTEDDMFFHYSADNKVQLKLIAGNYKGQTSKINTESDLMVLWGVGDAGGRVSIKIPNGFNSCLYLIKGDARIEGYGIMEPENLVVFESEEDEIVVVLNTEAQFIVLSGAPIAEPMVQHGPFVMNQETEILEAIRDYQMGKMGVLIED